MADLKENIEQRLRLMLEVVQQGREISEGDLGSLSDDLRAGKRNQGEALDVLNMASDYLGDLYDSGPITGSRNDSPGRVHQMLVDVHAEIKELERIEKVELSKLEYRALNFLAGKPYSLQILAVYVDIDIAEMSDRLLKPLQEAGLIWRDMKGGHVMISDAGRKVFESLPKLQD
jgi:predicted transcriptional regulator